MANAFAHAMLDQVGGPERDVRFTMRRTGWLAWMKFPFRCHDFVEVRPEEQELLREALRDVDHPRVLDIGCGIGRHLSFLQEEKPGAELTGLEINDLLRDYCRRTIPGSRFLPTLEAIAEGERFDLILMMGNGLGLYGNASATQRALRRIHGLLAEGGSLVAEAGNRYSRGFQEVRLVIEYQGAKDGPLSWGYSSERWLRRELDAIGCTVRSMRPSTIGREFFLCHAVRTV